MSRLHKIPGNSTTTIPLIIASFARAHACTRSTCQRRTGTFRCHFRWRSGSPGMLWTGWCKSRPQQAVPKRPVHQCSAPDHCAHAPRSWVPWWSPPPCVLRLIRYRMPNPERWCSRCLQAYLLRPICSGALRERAHDVLAPVAVPAVPRAGPQDARSVGEAWLRGS